MHKFNFMYIIFKWISLVFITAITPHTSNKLTYSTLWIIWNNGEKHKYLKIIPTAIPAYYLHKPQNRKTWSFLRFNTFFLLAHFLISEKKTTNKQTNKSRLMRSPCCLCVHPSQLNAWSNHYEIWCVYHGTWAHLNGVIHRSFPSVISILQFLKFLRKNLNIAWTPVPIFMKLCMYISCYLRPSQCHTS
jgi:hypothetical protein